MKADPTSNELLDLLKQSREYTKYFAELGVETIALSSNTEPSMPMPASAPVKASTHRDAPIGSEPAKSSIKVSVVPNPPASLFGELALPQFQSTERIEDIWRDIGDCTRCGLCEGRTQIVNTHGNHRARLMFVGEAPGADEDATGRPFVGAAGKLLDKIIEAVGYKREDVYISNVVKCRPPGNRKPSAGRSSRGRARSGRARSQSHGFGMTGRSSASDSESRR